MIKNKSWQFLHIVFHALLLSVVAGCASYREYEIPLSEATVFSQSGTEVLPNRWWETLNDQKLNQHIEFALSNNFSLHAAWQRLKAAKAISKRAASELYPALRLEASASRELHDARDNTSQFTLGPAASYEIDLWGRLRRSADASALRALASRSAYHTAALSLSGDVAITWVRLTEAHNQLSLLKRQLETNQKALKALKARFGIGQIRSEDILRQQLLIEAVHEERIAVETEIQILQHQLAVLRGEAPQGKGFKPSDRSPVLPALPQTGLPSALIQRRPDIQTLMLELEAADKDLAAAVRAQYPTITLSASYMSEAATAGNLFTDWVARIAGDIVAPIVDGGQRQAEVSRTEALRNERLNLYAQGVLRAFQEVENTLVREQQQHERIANLENRLRLASDTYQQIQLGYFNGASEFISVLSAQTAWQDIERDLLQAQLALVEFRIALYRALSGGFLTSRESNKKDSNDAKH